jgi:signal peptidase I
MKGKRAFTGFGLTLIVLFLFAIFLSLNFKSVIVDGRSMLPTLNPGQRVVVSKAYWLVGNIRKKDIVVIHDPTSSGYVIKRVFRLGGEKVPVDKWPESHRLEQGEYIVPEGDLFVLGDNIGQSEDSRKYGPVPLNRVIGKVVVRP